MTSEVSLLLVFAPPCASVVGGVIGYRRGRRDAEQNFRDAFTFDFSRIGELPDAGPIWGEPSP